MPRIVTIHDMKLSPFKNDDEPDSAKLDMTAVARTYRYLQEDEQ